MNDEMNGGFGDSDADHRAFAAYLMECRERERKAMARKIHDELGQLLSAVKMDLFWLEGNVRDQGGRVARRFEDTSGLIDMAIASVHDIVADLRPSVLDDLGIVEAVKWQTKVFQECHHIQCRLEVPRDDIVLTEAQATAAFRIFQDSLAGVLGRRGATQIDIGMAQAGGEFLLTVADNGQRGDASGPGEHGDGFHWMDMRARAGWLGGAVDIERLENSGTRVRVRLPLPVSLAKARGK